MKKKRNVIVIIFGILNNNEGFALTQTRIFL